jgi:hypothetical protein
VHEDELFEVRRKVAWGCTEGRETFCVCEPRRSLGVHEVGDVVFLVQEEEAEARCTIALQCVLTVKLGV